MSDSTPKDANSADSRKSPVPFAIIVLVCLGLPLLGKGGIIASVVLASALLGVPLFGLIGLVTIAGFILYRDYDQLAQFSPIVERMRALIDSKSLIAIPLFIMSGTVMARGSISTRLIDHARAWVGWIPGGLGMSAVVACVFFAAISGSSPATVIAIGSMMAPTLVSAGFGERFSHGLLTSAGSLGILIPPSIPMIIYPIAYQGEVIETELLFASGIGPGVVIAALMMGYCVVHGLKSDAPRDQFSWRKVAQTFVDGFWALAFPGIILGGIYSGLFTAVEAAAVSVVYAVFVEVVIHRALKLGEVPHLFMDTGIFLGSLLVIMVMALAFDEFLHELEIPQSLARAMVEMDLEQWQFLLLLNGLLLVVGMMMDIISAMLVFVPLLAPVAVSMGVDPLHFGIIFIVNLEIGYLTPPVGLNLFVSSTLFERPLGHIIRSVLPFIGLMLIGLVFVAYQPSFSVGLGHWLMGREWTPREAEPADIDELGGALSDDDDEVGEGMLNLEEMMQEAEGGDEGDGAEGGVQSLEEMMRAAEEGEDGAGEGADEGDGEEGVQSLEEMMREAAEEEAADPAADPAADEDAAGDPAPEDDGRVLSLEEMMREAGSDP